MPLNLSVLKIRTLTLNLKLTYVLFLCQVCGIKCSKRKKYDSHVKQNLSS